jgi:ABC-type uncharacterized transport system substrate-binding protein
VTDGTAAIRAAKTVTESIPIVMATSSDPVGTGLVANLNRPGGNITGLSLQTTELSGKRLQLLTEIVPGLARMAVLSNPLTMTVRQNFCPQRPDCVAGHVDGVSGLVAAVSGPLGDCASD